MIYEVCELVAAQLRDSAVGVNALVGSVPLAPADPALEPVTVKTEFEVPYLAFGRVPAAAWGAGPLVLVRCGVAILVLYPRQSDKTLDVENRRLSALLRVVRRSLGHWLEDARYPDRELRDVQVVGPLAPIRVVPTVAMLGGEDAVDVVGGAVLLELNVTDRWAEAITPLTP